MATLEEQIAAASENAKAARLAAWELERTKRIRDDAQFVGKFFKYRNCYSCPEKESDYWWLYKRVDSMDEDGILYGVQIQKDSLGQIHFESTTIASCNLQSAMEITELEFARAADGLLNEAERICKLGRGASV